jgi:phage shock protein A
LGHLILKQWEQISTSLNELKESVPIKKNRIKEVEKKIKDRQTKLQQSQKTLSQLIVEEQQLAEVVRNLRTQLEESKSSAQTAKRSR